MFAEKAEADKIAEQAEQIAYELLEDSAKWFTGNELFWLWRFTMKMRMGTSIEQEKKLLEHVRDIQKEVEKRKEQNPSLL